MYRELSKTIWYDNSERLLYDRERHGVDTCVIMSGALATSSGSDLDVLLTVKYHDNFAALAYPSSLVRRVADRKEKFTIEGVFKETEERLKPGK